MHYIFLDLEWNNSYSKSAKRSINEIIEIGAVKLDKHFREVSRFDVIIRSQITDKLNYRFKNLTSITNSEMEDGISFENAVKRYRKWRGKGNLTVTWSNSDVYTIMENYKMFLPGSKIDFIDKYLDLQKFFQNVLPSGDNNQVSLKVAAERLGIPLDDISLHRAVDDSAITAEIFRKVSGLGSYLPLVKDCTAPEFYDRLAFRPYLIYDLKSPLLKDEYFSFSCPRCNHIAVPKSKWKVANKQFHNEMRCPFCDFRFAARVSLKKMYDDVKVKKSILKPVSHKSNTKSNEKQKVTVKK